MFCGLVGLFFVDFYVSYTNTTYNKIGKSSLLPSTVDGALVTYRTTGRGSLLFSFGPGSLGVPAGGAALVLGIWALHPAEVRRIWAPPHLHRNEAPRLPACSQMAGVGCICGR